jgi:hypothetical protein
MLNAFRCLSANALWMLTTSCLFAQNPKVASLVDMQEFLAGWKISKQFAMDVANAMPAEFYNVKGIKPPDSTF